MTLINKARHAALAAKEIATEKTSEFSEKGHALGEFANEKILSVVNSPNKVVVAELGRANSELKIIEDNIFDLQKSQAQHEQTVLKEISILREGMDAGIKSIKIWSAITILLLISLLGVVVFLSLN